MFRLLHIPSPSPLALGILVTCQALQVNLVSLPLPADVLRALPTSHGETQISRALLDWLPTILLEGKEFLVIKTVLTQLHSGYFVLSPSQMLRNI